MYPDLEELTRKYFNFDFPSLKELERNSSIVLVNSDPMVDYPEPSPPNMIFVGGMQISPPKHLDNNIKSFIESGKKGTVLMSLGTNMKSSYFDDEKLKTILKTFESFPDFNFLWKFEANEEDLPIKLSRNVLISKFLPQNDILAHPNIKAFITHCGLLSTHEAFWYGVPIVGIPFFVDQPRNLQLAIEHGVGIGVDFLNLEQLEQALEEVLSVTNYSENAKKLSKVFRDKQQTPLEKAIWWVEFVIRNPSDIRKLQSPTLNLGFLASNSYDMIVSAVITFSISAYLMLITCMRKKF